MLSSDWTPASEELGECCTCLIWLFPLTLARSQPAVRQSWSCFSQEQCGQGNGHESAATHLSCPSWLSATARAAWMALALAAPACPKWGTEAAAPGCRKWPCKVHPTPTCSPADPLCPGRGTNGPQGWQLAGLVIGVAQGEQSPVCLGRGSCWGRAGLSPLWIPVTAPGAIAAVKAGETERSQRK